MSGKPGFLLILSAPSGAGKSTLARWALERHSRVRLSVSVTTRPPRVGEVDGVHYHFVSMAEFNRRLEENEFLEWAEVFGNRYGTSRLVVEEMLTAGGVVLLDIDWQGGRQVRRLFAAEDVVSVFIAPPSLDTLRQRLTDRQDQPEVVEFRMNQARQEISHWNEYDYFLVNDDLSLAQSDLSAILRAEELRRHRLNDSSRGMLADVGAAAE